MVGLNAGLGTYPTWDRTVLGLIEMSIPMAFSDPSKVSLRFNEVVWLPRVLGYIGMDSTAFPVDIKMNPFHGVVNRDIEVIQVPNIDNGYLLVLDPSNKQ